MTLANSISLIQTLVHKKKKVGVKKTVHIWKFLLRHSLRIVKKKKTKKQSDVQCDETDGSLE